MNFLGTRDAEQIELKLRRESNESRRDEEIIKHIMNKKIKDSQKDERSIRREFSNIKSLVNTEVEYKSEEGKILRRIQKERVSEMWTVGKERNNKCIRDMEKE